jgi:hypothetical protein
LSARCGDGHLPAVVFTAILTALFSVLGDPIFLLWFSLFNLLGNIYPLWLQRYNRLRVDRVMKRLKTR